MADDDVQRVATASTWHASADQQRVLEWGLPDDATLRGLLSGAADVQRRLAAQRDKDLAGHGRQILLVTGQAPLTPYGYAASTDGFTYVYTSAGDGYTTHASAALPGVDAWTVDAPHDQLASSTAALDGYVELLQRGTTSRLQRAAPATTRGTAPVGSDAAAANVRMRPARTPKRTPPPGGGDRLLGTTSEDQESLRDPAALLVTIVNGDLSFVRDALVIGHYRSSILTGTERVMDDLIGGAMRASLDTRPVPRSRRVAPGLRQHAAGDRSAPHAAAAGGRGGGARRGGQAEAGAARRDRPTGRAGVGAAVERDRETRRGFDLAATLIGSGGIDMGAAQSAQLVVQGVLQANQRLAHRRREDEDRDPDRPWPTVARLSLIEFYLDRAVEAWRGTADRSPGRGRSCELDPDHRNGHRRAATPDSIRATAARHTTSFERRPRTAAAA